MRIALLIAALSGILLVAGCGRRASDSITLATTTSVQDTGLLDELLPAFRAKTGVEVRVVAVGSGQALEIGRRGDADVLLTHDPAGEERFLAGGYGESRGEVMTNDFVLVGPADDPASVKGTKSAGEAFRGIAAKEAAFISRGDESGTHQKEKAVWEAVGVTPKGGWYVSSGQGMGAVLRMANEKRAYTLADRGTFVAQRGGLDLAVLHAGDPALVNRYSVIVVSPAKHPHARQVLAAKFAAFLLSDEAQRMVAGFGREKFGEPLFRPMARAGGKPE